MRAIINPILEKQGIDLQYEYAVYEHKPIESGFDFVLGDKCSSPEFQLTSCENPNERGHGWANLTCAAGGNLHLALFFPEPMYSHNQKAL
ncbi:hypothetical protein [Ekhidna sp.]|uniref:hypothetical protein n=1 Tax=Ekhidna sp. TaxID=2608089 RepID=UPI003B502A4C